MDKYLKTKELLGKKFIDNLKKMLEKKNKVGNFCRKLLQ